MHRYMLRGKQPDPGTGRITLLDMPSKSSTSHRTMQSPPSVPNTVDTPFLKLRMRVIAGGTNAIGPGKIELLEAIDTTRSLAAAAKSLGMSYRRAWLLVDELNQALCSPAVTATTGGARGGGSQLTETGRQVIELYRKIELQSAQACSEEIQQMVALVRGP